MADAGLGAAVLVLVLVLVVTYMSLRLVRARHPDGIGQLGPPAKSQRKAAGLSAGSRKDSFRGWTQYRPTCSGAWLAERRGHCKGLTTGAMPSIDECIPISWAPCCGSLGVPPPTYQ